MMIPNKLKAPSLMVFRSLSITFLLVILGSALIARETTGSERLTQNWEFIKSDLGGIWEAVRPVEKGSPQSVPFWEAVELPHSFNASDAVDPDVNYYQGPGWYRTVIEVNNPHQNGRTLLHFEGAGQKTDVYITMSSSKLWLKNWSYGIQRSKNQYYGQLLILLYIL